MKWFKHFVDSHRGKSLRSVRKIHGMDAVGMYWTLVEIVAEKFEPNEEGKFTEADCDFEFEFQYLCDVLGTKGSRLSKILNTYEALSLMCTTTHDSGSAKVLRIYMPNILEYKHKDAFSSRHWRDTVGDRDKNKDLKIKEKDSPLPPVGAGAEPEKDQKQNQEPEQNPNADDIDENQLVLEGVLKPSEGKSAIDLMIEVMKANNTALSKSQEVSKLIQFSEALQKSKNKKGWRKDKK